MKFSQNYLEKSKIFVNFASDLKGHKKVSVKLET